MQLIDIKLDYNHLAYFDTVLQECLHQQTNQTMIQELSQNSPVTWICDFGVLSYNLKSWRDIFPQVQPLFSLRYSKFGVSPLVKNLGVGFTCSNKRDLLSAGNSGVKTRNVVFDGENQPKSSLKAAVEQNCVVAANNEKDLKQIESFRAVNSRVIVKVSWNKNEEYYKSILDCAAKKNINVLGIGCDVSACSNEAEIEQIFNRTIVAMKYAESLGCAIEFLNLGGLSTADSDNSFKDQHVAKINSMLESKIFEIWPKLTVIADASDWLMSEVLKVVVTVSKSCGDKGVCSISDSVYGSFSGLMQYSEYRMSEPWALRPGASECDENLKKEFTILGCVGDDLDALSGKFWMPANLTEGDKIVFDSMEKFISNATLESIQFNALEEPKIEAVIHRGYLNLAKDLKCKEFQLKGSSSPAVQSENRNLNAVMTELIESISLVEQDQVNNRRNPLAAEMGNIAALVSFEEATSMQMMLMDQIELRNQQQELLDGLHFSCL